MIEVRGCKVPAPDPTEETTREEVRNPLRCCTWRQTSWLEGFCRSYLPAILYPIYSVDVQIRRVESLGLWEAWHTVSFVLRIAGSSLLMILFPTRSIQHPNCTGKVRYICIKCFDFIATASPVGCVSHSVEENKLKTT